MANKLPIDIRDMIESDISFIFNTWLKSYRKSRITEGIENPIYFNEHHKVIEDLLKRCDVVVASASDDSSIVYGYMVFEIIEGQFVIHWAYVKNDFRELGIFNAMQEVAGRDKEILGCYTHRTFICEKLEQKLNLIYHPYLVYRKDSKNE